jgi:tetratricopeptide (TPR) repeat protein
LAEADPALKENQEFLNILAHAYITSGQFDKFLKVLENLLSRKVGLLLHLQHRVSAKTQRLAQQYNSASIIFLKEQDLRTAFVLLNQSLNIKETAFADKWIGQILLVQRKFSETLTYLKKAEAMDLKDADLYYNLAAASYYLDRKEEAIRYLDKLEKIRSDYPDPSDLKKKLNLN